MVYLCSEESQNIYPTSSSMAQFHQVGCLPAMKFEEFNGGYWWNNQVPAGDDIDIQILKAEKFVGHWNDIVVYAHWSRGPKGWFKLWANGKLKLNYIGKTMTCEWVYFKYGIYRSWLSRNPKVKKITTIAYYDGVVRSKSKKGMFNPLLE